MIPRSRPALAALIPALLLAAMRPGHADPPLAARLEMLWSTPIATEMTTQGLFGKSEGLVLDAAMAGPDGTAVLLGRVIGGKNPGRVALRDAEHAGPDAAEPLVMPPPAPSASNFITAWLFRRPKPSRNPVVLGFAVDAARQTWLGGFANEYMGFASDSHRDAYLVKLDHAGQPLWERSYGDGGWLAIESIAPNPAGGVVGAGRGQRASWLARIAEDGTLLQEYRVGNGKGVAVVALQGGRFLVTGFEGEGPGAAYADAVSAWVLDDAGALRGPTRIRESINRESGSYFGHVAAAPVAGGAYVVSSWSDMFHPQPVEVSRVGLDGGLLWRRTLPSTVSEPKQTRTTTYDTCTPALAAAPGRDALVACALAGEIQLYRLYHDTGEVRSTRLPLPDCQRSHPAALFLIVPGDGKVLLGGSRAGGNVAGNCSWLARLIMQAD